MVGEREKVILVIVITHMMIPTSKSNEKAYRISLWNLYWLRLGFSLVDMYHEPCIITCLTSFLLQTTFSVSLISSMFSHLEFSLVPPVLTLGYNFIYLFLYDILPYTERHIGCSERNLIWDDVFSKFRPYNHFWIIMINSYLVITDHFKKLHNL